ncbi:hypothetical protein E2562_017043 [Oryza meyeriana var. granulata]|uniref:Uncharacterized protein n=1 Tax=Oryza meyeriana var. granulata TaxID=110450 RepID=A0A6G1F8J8_9ORYZ|nr:hypothetical protein E2562_017043 [Oryza meyeriana var. granulata]
MPPLTRSKPSATILSCSAKTHQRDVPENAAKMQNDTYRGGVGALTEFEEHRQEFLNRELLSRYENQDSLIIEERVAKKVPHWHF